MDLPRLWLFFPVSRVWLLRNLWQDSSVQAWHVHQQHPAAGQGCQWYSGGRSGGGGAVWWGNCSCWLSSPHHLFIHMNLCVSSYLSVTCHFCFLFKLLPHLKISRLGLMHLTCTHTAPRRSVITVERCCLDWSDRAWSVMVRISHVLKTNAPGEMKQIRSMFYCTTALLFCCPLQDVGWTTTSAVHSASPTTAAELVNAACPPPPSAAASPCASPPPSPCTAWARPPPARRRLFSSAHTHKWYRSTHTYTHAHTLSHSSDS